MECHSGLIVNLMVVNHLVHVVRRDRAYDVLALLIVPNLSALVQSTLVKFVKQRKGSWLVIFFLLLIHLSLLLLLRLTNQQDLLLFCFSRVSLLAFGLGLNVKIVGIVKVFR